MAKKLVMILFVLLATLVVPGFSGCDSKPKVELPEKQGAEDGKEKVEFKGEVLSPPTDEGLEEEIEK